MKILKLSISIAIIVIFTMNSFSQEKSASKFLGISDKKLNNALENNKKVPSFNKEEKNTLDKNKKKQNRENKLKEFSSKLQTKVISTKVNKENFFIEIEEEILHNRNDSLIYLAKQLLGVKYRYGGTSPKSGFDCSGFVNYVFSYFNVGLPRSSSGIARIDGKVKKENCKKGDILVFAGGNPKTRPIGHVALVISTKNDDIEFIHASTQNGVIITKLNESKYYQKRLVSIIRQ